MLLAGDNSPLLYLEGEGRERLCFSPACTHRAATDAQYAMEINHLENVVENRPMNQGPKEGLHPKYLFHQKAACTR